MLWVKTIVELVMGKGGTLKRAEKVSQTRL